MMNENLIAEELRNCGPCTLPSFSYSLRNATRCCIHPDSGDSNRREPQSVHRNAGLRFPDFSLPYDTSVTYIKTYNRAIRGGCSVSSQHIHFHQPDGFFPFPPSKPKRQQSFPESNQPNKNSDSGKTERYQMKKIAYLGMLAVAGMLFAGCASSGTNGEVAEKYKQFQEAVAQRPPAYVPCGEPALDDVGKLSAQVYGSLIKYLDEYVKATENNRYYIGFTNDVNEVAKEKKISAPEAMAQVWADYQKLDEGKPAEEQICPKVSEGFHAVEALKPENKLKELLPIAAQAAKVALQAKEVADTVTKTYSSINFGDVEGMKKKALVTATLAKVTEQAAFNTCALDFLQDQFKRNQEMKQYMQK